MSVNTPVSAHFDKISPRYRAQFSECHTGANFHFRKRLRLACEIACNSTGSLLDCAAGTGEITLALLQSSNFQRATVVDIAPRMLAASRELLTTELATSNVALAGLEFCESDIFNFGAANEQYDLIVCLGLIAHSGRLDQLLPHLKSLLSPNGRVLLQSSLIDHLGNRIVRASRAKAILATQGYQLSYFSHDDIEHASRNAGLEIKQMCRYGVNFPFLERAWPWLNYHLETRLQTWASRHGAEAIYLLGA
jgi:ubiquinone/menaquinone biosynthesis C-methylase UbiE